MVEEIERNVLLPREGVRKIEDTLEGLGELKTREERSEHGNKNGLCMCLSLS